MTRSFLKHYNRERLGTGHGLVFLLCGTSFVSFDDARAIPRAELIVNASKVRRTQLVVNSRVLERAELVQPDINKFGDTNVF